MGDSMGEESTMALDAETKERLRGKRPTATARRSRAESHEQAAAARLLHTPPTGPKADAHPAHPPRSHRTPMQARELLPRSRQSAKQKAQAECSDRRTNAVRTSPDNASHTGTKRGTVARSKNAMSTQSATQAPKVLRSRGGDLRFGATPPRRPPNTPTRKTGAWA